MPYMGCIVHEEWNLQTQTLGTKYVSDNHTGDVMESAMINTLDEGGWIPQRSKSA